jgi:hypothetical protein
MEETIMKKISVKEARQLLMQGIFPKCEVSRDVFKPVKSERELMNFLDLSSLQKCQFYGFDNEEIENFKVPDGSLTMSSNEALAMVADGEKIFARIIGENEQSFSNLTSFGAFLKRCEVNGENYLLYWHE